MTDMEKMRILWFIINFIARVTILSIIACKKGWGTALLAVAYAVLTQISPEI